MGNFIFRAEAAPARACTACRKLLLAWSLLLSAPSVQSTESMAMSSETAAVTSINRYQSWRDEPIQDWREANDRVSEIGGWLSYMRDAQQGDEQTGSSMHDHHHHHGH